MPRGIHIYCSSIGLEDLWDWMRSICHLSSVLHPGPISSSMPVVDNWYNQHNNFPIDIDILHQAHDILLIIFLVVLAIFFGFLVFIQLMEKCKM